MEKRIVAMATLCLLGGSVRAETDVTIYGVVDAGVVREIGGAAGGLTKLTGGIGSGSRLGFRGTEDLGGGMKARFVLENGFGPDTGSLGQGGLLFGRQAFVGLDTNFGNVALGRQYTPYFLTLLNTADPFMTGFAGTACNLMSNTGGRMNNTVKYTSPSWSGFSGEAAYGFGEVAGNSTGGRAVGFAAGYRGGPTEIQLAYHNVRDQLDTGSTRNTLLAVTYDFGMIKANFGYAINKGLGTVDSRDVLVGGTVRMGTGRIITSYIRKDDRSTFNRDANQIAIGYIYPLSKRTDLYASTARIGNMNGATYTVGNTSGFGRSCLQCRNETLLLTNPSGVLLCWIRSCQH